MSKSNLDDLPPIDLNEIALIQGDDREKRMENMLKLILEKLEHIEQQMLREMRRIQNE